MVADAVKNIGETIKKSVFEMNWDEFADFMNSEEVKERWNGAMEKAEKEDLEAKRVARDFWVH
ncbi:MAG: hypothetical protein CVT88_05315 [Candidatus Altiarchaeales archaeon HGW-Altiarchaeales-1]|nr:MAG: hypothetical protein CVT88_05315 [Candidatus Altiarchaeales archaeon HGW-Altiarchaeales-1]